jgi:hypothetical protein
MSINLVNGFVALKALVDNSIATGKAFDPAIHEAAYNCLCHAVSTGDIRPMAYLYKRHSAKARFALREYAVAFGPFKYNAKLDELRYQARNDSDVQAAENIGPMEYVKPKKPMVKKAFTDEAMRQALDRLLIKASSNRVGLGAKKHILKAMEALTIEDEFTQVFTE